MCNAHTDILNDIGLHCMSPLKSTDHVNLGSKARELFLQACPSFYSIFFLESPPPGMVVSMAKIFHEARFNRYLTNELARFVAGIHACRREAFASLSKRGPLNPLRVALERVVLPDQSD